MAPPVAIDFETALSTAAQAVESALDMALPVNETDRLRTAMRYAVLGPGKRLRPFFVMESCKLYGIADSTALGVATALECVHCYSLVHDDLPAMDNDDLRRGQPTLHKKFDEATAILAGDALLTYAFDILANDDVTLPLISSLAKAAGASGMVGGQMLDIQAETQNFPSIDAISNMQIMKTSALFEFACGAGPVLAKSDPTALRHYAKNIGLAFQIADDVLDLEATAEVMGKATQKDRSKGKATFVDLLGLEPAKAEAQRLVNVAVAALEPYGARADILREAAKYIINRPK